ncbi:MAG: DUF349 domain-containing protein [Bacteroidia bacterium]
MITDNENNMPPDAAPNVNAENNNNQSVEQNYMEGQTSETQSKNTNPEPEVIVPEDVPPAEINLSGETTLVEEKILPNEGELKTEDATIEPQPEVIVPEDVPPAEINVVEITAMEEEETALSDAASIEALAPISESAYAELDANVEIIQNNASVTEIDEPEYQESGTDETDALENQPAYNEMSRPELAEALKELISRNDLERHKTAFHAMRDAYRNAKDEEIRLKKSKFIENGGLPEEFEVLRDEADEQFDSYAKLYIERRNDERKQKEQQLKDNLKQKQVILAELKKLLEQTENISGSFDRLHELQNQWRSIGLVPAAYVDELWKNYHHHINNFYEIIKINKELRELDQKKNLELKTALCIKAEELLLHESISKSLDEYIALQTQWKEIGQVGKEQSEVLWERFRSAGDKLFERRRSYIQEQEAVFTENHNKKIAVCERAEVITGEMPFKNHVHWQEASEKMAAALEEWKKIGFASKKDNESVWQRFKTSRDAFYDAKEQFYKDLRNTQNQNYKQKVDLCMEAEALKDSTEWKKTGARLKELQDLWKSTGPVAKKHSDKLWERFRKACDVFYESRNQHFSGMNSEQDENLRKKLELMAEIEAYESDANTAGAFETLKNFQARWMEIGHVPLKEKDALNKRYRSAIDKQFSKIKTGNAEMRRQHFREQVSNLAADPGGKDKLNQQKNVVQDKLRRMQTELQTLENNIGFLAKSKGADELRKDIERKISKTRAEIASLNDQLKILKSS